MFRLDEAARLRCVPDARLGPEAREADSRAWGSAYPSRDEARRIAVNIAKLPELLRKP